MLPTLLIVRVGRIAGQLFDPVLDQVVSPLLDFISQIQLFRVGSKILDGFFLIDGRLVSTEPFQNRPDSVIVLEPIPVEKVDVDKTRLGSTSTLCSKEYPLDPQNLAGSYLEQLDSAVGQFCVNNPDLLTVLNEVFEQSYQTVFETEPVGEFPGPVQPKR